MNHLQDMKAFEAALSGYEPSDESKELLSEGKLVILTGASSSGRNTIINHMMGTGRYHFIISDTTRKPRLNDGVLEQNGVEYWFRDEADMLSDIQKGAFVEAEILHSQQVSGISVREIARAMAEGRIAINDIDIGGIYAVRRAKPDTRAFLILPPNFAVWQQRLAGRGAMEVDELVRRLTTASNIFADAETNEFFDIVINNDATDAAREIDQLVMNDEPQSLDRQDVGRGLARTLLRDTIERLDELSKG